MFTSCVLISNYRVSIHLIYVELGQVLWHKYRGDGPSVLTDLSVTVLPSLGGGHLHNLARSSFEHHKAIFAQSWALHGVSAGSPGIARLEVQVCICHHCWEQDRLIRYKQNCRDIVIWIYNCSMQCFMPETVKSNWWKCQNLRKTFFKVFYRAPIMIYGYIQNHRRID